MIKKRYVVKKILTVLGARPQFIKAGSVSREILKHHSLNEIIVHTGQHYDANMSNIFFEEMSIPKPDYLLGIGGKSHGAMTGQMIEKIEEVLITEMPDVVMVYGDTNSTLAGAIAASKLGIKIAHVEAGLRSFNMAMPEEINRILTDRISNLLYCPTPSAIKNLQMEGFDSFNSSVFLSGDVMQDGALFYKKYSTKPLEINDSEDFVLCTLHRAENTDDIERLSNIVSALNKIALDRRVIFPLHPRTKARLESFSLALSEGIEVIEPVGYLNMIWLIDNCSIVLTDSGGLQKEAFFFSKPCITLRDETEWSELVENGFNKLAGANAEAILELYKNAEFNSNFELNLFGGGKASVAIVESLLT